MSTALLWRRLPANRQALRRQHWLSRLHPWGAAALALHPSVLQALRCLRRWRRDGLSPADLEAIAAAPAQAFPLLRGPGPGGQLRPGCHPQLQIWAETQPAWLTQAWQQHLPGAAASAEAANSGPSLAERLGPLWTQQCWLGLHLQPVNATAAAHQLVPLASLELVFDPDPQRVELLRRLGVQALLLLPQASSANDLALEASASGLGLPDPQSLRPPQPAPGDGPAVLICLGSGGEAWERSLDAAAPGPALWCLPRFEQLQLSPPGARQVLVAWLNRCQQLGFQLVRLGGTGSASERLAFRGLRQPEPHPPGWLPPQFFRDPISPEQLQAELTWRRAGRPAPEPCRTPTPAHEILWSHSTPGQSASASICISLYNYGSRISAALESVLAQSHQALELVVVDDHSSDNGCELVQQWLEQHRHRFSRALLLRHQHNAGLAAARNTAFQAATAPWCFVLDADNSLLPHAVELCLQVAHHSDDRTAVVHPLVEVVAEAGRLDPRTLLSGLSWQRSQFRHGNVVDAMALVRRSAWEAVHGFTHIPGGWEDFDFWCKLIDGGWHGVLCPQRLAVYRSHGTSMLATSSQRQERRLSRLLQARHPWLQLAPADVDA